MAERKSGASAPVQVIGVSVVRQENSDRVSNGGGGSRNQRVPALSPCLEQSLIVLTGTFALNDGGGAQ